MKMALADPDTGWFECELVAWSSGTVAVAVARDEPYRHVDENGNEVPLSEIDPNRTRWLSVQPDGRLETRYAVGGWEQGRRNGYLLAYKTGDDNIYTYPMVELP